VNAAVGAPIAAVDVRTYRVPLDEPESAGTATWDATTVVVVHVHAEGGTGLGWTYGPGACAAVVAERLRPVVLGRAALDVTGTWEAMARAVRNDGRPGVCSMAMSAVDTALWDLKARLLDLPLCSLLGAVRHEVPVYGSGGFCSLTDAQLRAQLGGWVHDEGIPRVKMKVGEAWGACGGRDLARARVAREAIGDEAELMVDANGGYQRKQAIRLAAPYADLGATWFEEPVSSDDRDGLAEIRAAVPLDVAAGEYGYRLADLAVLVPVVDVLQVDVSRCGGITEWLRAAAVAAAAGLQVSGHCAPTLHAHVAAGVPNLRHLEWFADHVRADRLLFDGVPTATGGVIRLDGGSPGHGVALRPADAAPFLVDERLDGGAG
jgi:L-alanine-DL-glutamate epimerase-like enolase superfamily enzyme